jgi:hypothetical protein
MPRYWGVKSDIIMTILFLVLSAIHWQNPSALKGIAFYLEMGRINKILRTASSRQEKA